TIQAIHQLSLLLDVKSSEFSYAGMKDKRAITLQRVAVSGVSKDNFKNVYKLLEVSHVLPDHLRISHVIVTSLRLITGNLVGNRFDIKLRNVHGGKTTINIHLTLITTIIYAILFFKTKGFINYFGPQRFGRRIDTKEPGSIPQWEAPSVGLAMLKQNMKRAVEILLLPAVEAGKPIDDEQKGKLLFQQTWNVEEALKLMPRHRFREIGILQSLQQTSSSEQFCSKALLTIPFKERTFYAHSYSSYLWNRVASERLRQLGCDVIEGDLVIQRTGDSENIERHDSEVHVVVSDDVKCNRFSIYDVVLPLPGNRVQYPPNLDAVYDRIFKEDQLFIGTEPKASNYFRVNKLKLNLCGTYRRLIEKPKNFTINWESDVSSQAVTGDEGMRCTTLADDGATLGLKFDLPSSCYATSILRELSKDGVTM
uniref:Pseudouridylate synthase 7 homolog-like protein n=1 Tax=Ciona intestinalis TaxID=7719 RepID=F6SVP7_CIOIN